jgi:hypothetical protein
MKHQKAKKAAKKNASNAPKTYRTEKGTWIIPCPEQHPGYYGDSTQTVKDAVANAEVQDARRHERRQIEIDFDFSYGR